MKALTLRPPWGSFIVAGLKTSETRSWPPPRDLIGKRFAIHQGLHRTRLDEVGDDLADFTTEQLGILDGRATGSPFLDPYGHLPRGVVVATVRLVVAGQVVTPPDLEHDRAFICRTPDGAMFDGRDDGLGDYRLGRWVWQLDDNEPLDEPIPAVGRQRIWDWDPPEGVLL